MSVHALETPVIEDDSADDVLRGALLWAGFGEVLIVGWDAEGQMVLLHTPMDDGEKVLALLDAVEKVRSER